MNVRALKPALLGAAFAILSAAWFCPALAGDYVYRWTDKSGQENFTDDINNVPEPYKSKFKKEDEQRKAKSQRPPQQQAEPPPPLPFSSTAPVSPQPQDESGIKEGIDRREPRIGNSTQSDKDMTPEEKARKKKRDRDPGAGSQNGEQDEPWRRE